MKKIILTFLLLAQLIPVVSFAGMKEFKLPVHGKWVTKLKKEKVLTTKPYQFTSPIVDYDRIFVGAASGYIYCLNRKDGHKVWFTKLDGGVYGDPVVSGAYVYIGDRKGNVYSINKLDGKTFWETNIGGEISSKPIVTDDKVYFVTALGQLVALNKESGARLWHTIKDTILPSMTIKGSSDPVLYNGYIYVGLADGSLVKFSSADGNKIWEKQLSNKRANFVDADASPVIADDVIYISSVDGKTFALKVSDGGEIWRIEKGGANDVAVEGDRIYLSVGGVVTCASRQTGITIWETSTGDVEISTPAVKDNVVAVASTDSRLYSIDKTTGELKYKRYIRKGSFGDPIIVDDMLYVLSNTSRLFAFEGSRK